MNTLNVHINFSWYASTIELRRQLPPSPCYWLSYWLNQCLYFHALSSFALPSPACIHYQFMCLFHYNVMPCPSFFLLIKYEKRPDYFVSKRHPSCSTRMVINPTTHSFIFHTYVHTFMFLVIVIVFIENFHIPTMLSKVAGELFALLIRIRKVQNLSLEPANLTDVRSFLQSKQTIVETVHLDRGCFSHTGSNSMFISVWQAIIIKLTGHYAETLPAESESLMYLVLEIVT